MQVGGKHYKEKLSLEYVSSFRILCPVVQETVVTLTPSGREGDSEPSPRGPPRVFPVPATLVLSRRGAAEVWGLQAGAGPGLCSEVALTSQVCWSDSEGCGMKRLLMSLSTTAHLVIDSKQQKREKPIWASFWLQK